MKTGDDTVEYKEICGTRVWLSRVIHSVDGDNDTLYELTYVPHSERLPKTITGDAELINIANLRMMSWLARAPRFFRNSTTVLEEFLIDCQKYGVKEIRSRRRTAPVAAAGVRRMST